MTARRTMPLRIGALVLGVALALEAALRADADRIDGLGILRTLPLTYFLGVGVVLVNAAMGTTLVGRRASAWAATQLIALAVLLHGLPGLLEPNPRFAVAWLHTGFIDHVAEHGTLLQLDGRFSWAGFFTGAAVIQRAGDTDSVLWMVRFAPVAIDLFACWGIGLLGGVLGATPRRRFLAMVLFLLVNWTGQDYFSPQATTFCLALVVLVVVLRFFGGDPSASMPRLAGLLRATAVVPARSAFRTRAVAYLGTIVCLAAIATSHQLTPVYLAGVLLLLGWTGVTRLRGLGLAATVITCTWISYGATAYWRGHLRHITGSVGRVESLVQDNVSSRTSGSGVDRTLAVWSRIGVALLVWVAAGVVVLVAFRRRRTPVALVCLVAGAVPLFVAQSYGGEMLIRIFLFSLPASVILIASGLDTPALRTVAGRAAVAVGMAALVPVLVVARFGNEHYEQVTNDDRDVVAAAYAAAPDGSVIFTANRQTVFYSERVDAVRFRQLDELDAEVVIDQLRRQGPRDRTFVLLTESQSIYGEEVQHREPGWMDELAASLIDTGDFVVVDRVGLSQVLRFVGEQEGDDRDRG